MAGKFVGKDAAQTNVPKSFSRSRPMDHRCLAGCTPKCETRCQSRSGTPEQCARQCKVRCEDDCYIDDGGGFVADEDGGTGMDGQALMGECLKPCHGHCLTPCIVAFMADGHGNGELGPEAARMNCTAQCDGDCLQFCKTSVRERLAQVEKERQQTQYPHMPGGQGSEDEPRPAGAVAAPGYKLDGSLGARQNAWVSGREERKAKRRERFDAITASQRAPPQGGEPGSDDNGGEAVGGLEDDGRGQYVNMRDESWTSELGYTTVSLSLLLLIAVCGVWWSRWAAKRGRGDWMLRRMGR